MIFLAQRWRRAPEYPVEIDWANPLTRGLVFAALFNGRMHDSARGLALTAENIGVKFTDAGLVPAPGAYFMSGSTPVVATPLSMSCRFWTPSTEQSQVLMSIANGNEDLEYWQTGFNTDNTLRAASRSNDYFAANTSATFAAGRWQHSAGVYGSNTSRFAYLNGTAGAESTDSSSPGGATRIGISILARFNVAGVYFGFIQAPKIWNRALTSDEVRADSDNSFQIWRRQKHRIYIVGAAGGALNERSATDGMYLFDYHVKSELHQRTEGFFMRDEALRSVGHLEHDKMLVADQLLSQATRQPYALDTLLLADNRRSAHGRLQYDPLLLGDSRISAQAKTLLDNVLLTDYSVKSLLKILADGLLLFDQATTGASQQYSVTAVDGLYLKDYFLREILKIIRDAMLLVDSVSTQFSGGSNTYTVTATDFLLLGDSGARTLLKQVIEFMLLGDSVQREVLRTRIASDGVFLSDLTQRAIAKYGLDEVLLDDVSRRVREMLLREGVYLSDSQSVSLIVIGAEFLSYARLRMVHLLGIRLGVTRWDRFGVEQWDVWL